MRITQVKIHLIDGPDLFGYAEITIDDCFCVGDIHIFRQPRGYRIAMPRGKLKNGAYKEIAFALDAKTRKMIEDAVIAVIREIGWERQPSSMKTLLWVILATVTFIVFFYSGTVVMSILYPLDEALLSF